MGLRRWIVCGGTLGKKKKYWGICFLILKHNCENSYIHINRTFRVISLTEKLCYLHTKRILGQNMREGILLFSYHEMGVGSKNVGGASHFWALLTKNHILHDLIRDGVQTLWAWLFDVTFLQWQCINTFWSSIYLELILSMRHWEKHWNLVVLVKNLVLISSPEKWVIKEPKLKGQCMCSIYNNYLKLKCIYSTFIANIVDEKNVFSFKIEYHNVHI